MLGNVFICCKKQFVFILCLKRFKKKTQSNIQSIIYFMIYLFIYLFLEWDRVRFLLFEH